MFIKSHHYRNILHYYIFYLILYILLNSSLTSTNPDNLFINPTRKSMSSFYYFSPEYYDIGITFYGLNQNDIGS